MGKLNDTTNYQIVTPAEDDLLFGTDVSDTTNDANGETVNFQPKALHAMRGPMPPGNLIINGGMDIWQRGTSFASIADGAYSADRWRLDRKYATFTASRDTDVPTGRGFSYSWKLDCTATASPAAGNFIIFNQRLEGQFLQAIRKGTASAKQLTLSFWVKSNTTRTIIVELNDLDNARNVSAAVTLSASDTWEYVTVTFPADTTGAFDNDNARSLDVNFWLGAGTDYTSGTLNTTWSANTAANRAVGVSDIGDNTANYINITGVQLELGDTASEFEFLPYDDVLRKCQRYYIKYSVPFSDLDMGGNRYGLAGGLRSCGHAQFPVPMRDAPSSTDTSITYTNASALAWSINEKGATARCTVTANGNYRAYPSTTEFNAEL